MGKLTSAASWTCSLATSRDTTNATFLLGAAGGPTPSASQDGRTTALVGLGQPPASPSQMRERAGEPRTSGTCGQRSSTLSASATLTLCLANKLKRQLGTDGSTLYSQTWKARTTPAGRLFWAHTASVPRTSGSGSTGWPTPTAYNTSRPPEEHEAKSRELVESGTSPLGMPLPVAAQLAGWGTVTAADNYKVKSGTSRCEGQENWRLGNQARLAGWGTPNAMDSLPSCNLEERMRKGGCSNVKDQVTLLDPAGWGTPTTFDQGKEDGTPYCGTFTRGKLGNQARLGMPASGSPALTGRFGQLNPDFCRWLMGYPKEHLSSAPTETPSSRKRRQRSSGRSRRRRGDGRKK